MCTTAEIKQFFDERAAGWDAHCVHDPAKLEAIVTLAGVSAGSHVLDIACGTGALFSALLARNPACLTGVDLSDAMIAVAAQKFHDSSLRLLASDLFSLTASDFPEAPGGFDSLFVYSAYPHFLDKDAFAKQLYSLAAPGGRIMVAHSESRETINSRHHGAAVQQVSTSLRAAAVEAAVFAPYFDVDILVDTPALYLISGVKRQA